MKEIHNALHKATKIATTALENNDVLSSNLFKARARIEFLDYQL